MWAICIYYHAYNQLLYVYQHTVHAWLIWWISHSRFQYHWLLIEYGSHLNSCVRYNLCLYLFVQESHSSTSMNLWWVHLHQPRKVSNQTIRQSTIIRNESTEWINLTMLQTVHFRTGPPAFCGKHEITSIFIAGVWWHYLSSSYSMIPNPSMLFKQIAVAMWGQTNGSRPGDDPALMDETMGNQPDAAASITGDNSSELQHNQQREWY